MSDHSDLPDPAISGTLHRLGPYNRIPIQTSRGCPWDCDFCAASKLFGPRYRLKPAAQVLEEIDLVCSLWPRPFIEFADDNTFVILHAAKNEAGANVWKLCVMRDFSGARCSVGIFARQPSMAARKSAKIL